jgi:O-antigen/teichoic acid export membrane protein
MEKRHVLINAIVSILQTVAAGITLFILYRFLLKTIGVEQLGIWSLVVAITGMAQMTNFGLSGSVVKFVAKYVARNEREIASKVIQTAAISVGIMMTLVLLAGYPIAKWILELVTPIQCLQSAFDILPLTFVAFWLLIVTSIFQSGLDGVQRIDLKGFLLIAGSIVNLIFCYVLVPPYGLVGVAYARVIENSGIFIGSWFVLKRKFSVLPTIPYKWDRNLFKEMLNYGINFQIISVTAILHDPITKAFLSKFGSLSMVGYYEMASKMMWHLRGLLVSATQVIVPAIANMQEKIPDQIRSAYITCYGMLFYLALPFYSFTIVSMPLVSELWVGYYESVFILFSALLAIGYFFNTLSIPAFYVNLGTGKLVWNVLGMVTIGLLNTLLGLLFGSLFDGVGVVVGLVIALVIGSALIVTSYHVKNKLPLINIVPKTSNALILSCLVSTMIVLLLQYESLLDSIGSSVISIVLFVLIVVIPVWFHPMKKRLKGWVTNELLSRR